MKKKKMKKMEILETINFEMGVIDPRKKEFDHHGKIEHSNAFIAKMSSVQVIEWAFINDFPIIAPTINHVGHLDDFILFAINDAVKQNKIRNLYKFALQASGIDSCGPCLRGLLDTEVLDLIDKTYSFFQSKKAEVIKNLGIKSYKFNKHLMEATLCSKKTAKFILDFIPEDNEKKPEKLKIPNKKDYNLIKVKGESIAIIEILSDNFNPFIYAPFFYQNYKYLVFFTMMSRYKDYTYTILCKSPYSGNLAPLWEILNEEEVEAGGSEGWGGHTGAGGSPRQFGSLLLPQTIVDCLLDIIKNEEIN
jgi:hypothetical protein